MAGAGPTATPAAGAARTASTCPATRRGGPDRFDLSRDPSGHVGGGFGLHQCVGQHVPRLEAEALLTALAARVERLELAGPTVRHHNNTQRAWDSLPVRVEPT